MIEFSQSSIDDVDENYIAYMFVSSSQLLLMANEFTKLAHEVMEMNSIQQKGRFIDSEKFLAVVRFYIDRTMVLETDESLTTTILSFECGDIIKRSENESDSMDLQNN